MSISRQSHATISLMNGAWITGGSGPKKDVLSSTEIMFINGTTSFGPQLPDKRSHHCIIKYKQMIFIIGGWSGSEATSTVWIFDENKGIQYFGGGPDMNYARRQFACAIFYSKEHNNNPLIVVVGGLGSASTSSEFWDFTRQGSKWELSKLILCIFSFLFILN